MKLQQRLEINKISKPEQLMHLYIRLLVESMAGDGLQDISFSRINLQDHTKYPPLPRKNNLRALSFVQCKFGVNELREILKYCTCVETLTLSENALDDTSAEVLAEFLQANDTLTELNLSHNSITDAGAMALFTALENSKLHTLNLEDNHIKLVAREGFAEAIKRCHGLTSLHLGSNQLGDHGICAIAEVLQTSNKLKCLDLSGTLMENSGLTILTNALKHNTTLEHVLLCSNGIDDHGARTVGELLEINSALLRIDLALNPISALAARHIAQAILRLVCRVREVSLSDTNTHRIVLLAMNKATVARNVYALRSAAEARRLGARSSLRNLPRELSYMVACCLTGLPAETEEEYYDSDESYDNDEDGEEDSIVDDDDNVLEDDDNNSGLAGLELVI